MVRTYVRTYSWKAPDKDERKEILKILLKSSLLSSSLRAGPNELKTEGFRQVRRKAMKCNLLPATETSSVQFVG